VSPPRCTGELSCKGVTECQTNCRARATANVDCPAPQVTIAVTGDADLERVFRAHAGDIGVAINLTTALREPIATCAKQTPEVFNALGDIGATGVACVASSLEVAAHASASINVCVSATAVVQGKGGFN
jgi:hypothetical protein